MSCLCCVCTTFGVRTEPKRYKIWLTYTLGCWLSAFYTVIWKARNYTVFEDPHRGPQPPENPPDRQIRFNCRLRAPADPAPAQPEIEQPPDAPAYAPLEPPPQPQPIRQLRITYILRPPPPPALPASQILIVPPPILPVILPAHDELLAPTSSRSNKRRRPTN
jgi:hypothetical protein